MSPVRFAIFASGTGSNAEALIKKIKALPGGCLEFVLSDRSKAPVLEKARKEGVTSYLVEKKMDRASHEQEIMKLIDQHEVDWIFLAGYMRLLSADFLRALSLRHQNASQVVNIHPSLLPNYPGAQSIERAFADRVAESGVTLHLVDEGMDTGPILFQEKIILEPFLSFSDFKMRMHQLEHRMYTDLLEKIVQGEIPTKYFKEVISC